MIRYLFVVAILCSSFCYAPRTMMQQSLQDSRKQNPFLMLAYQAKCGNAVSMMAYQAYADILAHKKSPRYVKDRKVIDKLVSLGLCSLHKGVLQLESFYINDELVTFRKKK